MSTDQKSKWTKPTVAQPSPEPVPVRVKFVREVRLSQPVFLAGQTRTVWKSDQPEGCVMELTEAGRLAITYKEETIEVFPAVIVQIKE